MSFHPLFLISTIGCVFLSSCSRESAEETAGEKRKTANPSTSNANSIHEPGARFQSNESNYSVDLSSQVAVSIDQASFSEAIDLNENGQCFDKQTGRVIEGQYRILSQSGDLLSSSSFRNGFYHGKREDYHENGVTSISSNYFYGKKNGKEEWRAENGIKTYEANFREGLIDGIETTWNEDGQVVSKYRFEEGKLVERLIENGITVSQ